MPIPDSGVMRRAPPGAPAPALCQNWPQDGPLHDGQLGLLPTDAPIIEESGGSAHGAARRPAAELSGTPFLAIKVVTDIVDGPHATQDEDANLSTASERSKVRPGPDSSREGVSLTATAIFTPWLCSSVTGLLIIIKTSASRAVEAARAEVDGRREPGRRLEIHKGRHVDRADARVPSAAPRREAGPRGVKVAPAVQAAVPAAHGTRRSPSRTVQSFQVRFRQPSAFQKSFTSFASGCKPPASAPSQSATSTPRSNRQKSKGESMRRASLSTSGGMTVLSPARADGFPQRPS